LIHAQPQRISPEPQLHLLRVYLPIRKEKRNLRPGANIE